MVKPGRLCYVLPPCENRVGKFFGAGGFLPSTHHLIGCGGECPYLTRIRGNMLLEKYNVRNREKMLNWSSTTLFKSS